MFQCLITSSQLSVGEGLTDTGQLSIRRYRTHGMHSLSIEPPSATQERWTPYSFLPQNRG